MTDKKNKKPSSACGFMMGVFVTTWVGMFAYIVVPFFQPAAAHTTPIQTAEMSEALRLSLDDLK